MQIKKYETKDRYGNSKSFEFFEGSADMDIPGMTNMPDHPGEPKGTDTVPAWLTPGEFVINKEATDMYGPLLMMKEERCRMVNHITIRLKLCMQLQVSQYVEIMKLCKIL